MKRYLLFLVPSCLLLASPAHAQLGLRAGGNLTRLATAAKAYGEAASTERQAGYQVGLCYQLPLGGRFSLVPELQLTSERRQLVTSTLNLLSSFYPTPAYTSDLRQRFTYLQLPVLARLTWGQLYVEAGPQASYLLGGHEEGQLSTYDPYLVGWGYYPGPTAVERSVRDRYRHFDAGACVGVGLEVAAGIGLSVRAYQGLLSLTQADNADVYYYQGRQLRQTLQASLTYQLPAHP